MRNFFQWHRDYWSDTSFLISTAIGILFLSVSIFINHFSSMYADMWAGNSVTDILLDNIPATDVDGILGYGALLLGMILIALCLSFPRMIPFILKSAALFILIRSGFIILTHLGPSLEKTPIDEGFFLSGLLSGNDLFFSGHTGFPFLLMLIFWDRAVERFVFLLFTVVFATAVILGHLHYSIDVFSAFFITYSIFHLAQWFFHDDWTRCRGM